MHLRVVAVALVLFLVHSCKAAPQEQLESVDPEPVDAEPEQVAPQVKPHVSILKQINQINKDGSYTYGFEASDGSFRVETRDVNGHVKGRYGYIDEFGEVKAVAYESGTKQGFAPRGQHIPTLPRVSKSGGNIGEDDEFGTDEDWNSIDADQDGQPDPPRPKDQRPVVTTKPPRVTTEKPRPAPPVRSERPEPPVFISVEEAPQPERPAPRPVLIPAEEVPRSFRPFQPFQRQPQQLQFPPQQFRFLPERQPFRDGRQHEERQPFHDGRQHEERQQFRDDREHEEQPQFTGPIFPSQFSSIPPGFPQQRSFNPVPFSFQQQQQPRE